LNRIIRGNLPPRLVKVEVPLRCALDLTFGAFLKGNFDGVFFGFI
jgi:hypothetical protein